MIEYKKGDIEHNIKAAVNNLREAYWSGGVCDEVRSQFRDAEELIIDAICHHGYILVKEDNQGNESV